MTTYSPVALRYQQEQIKVKQATATRRIFITTCLVLATMAIWLSYKTEPTCQSLHGQTWDLTTNQPIACR